MLLLLLLFVVVIVVVSRCASFINIQHNQCTERLNDITSVMINFILLAPLILKSIKNDLVSSWVRSLKIARGEN
jgi:hypothetical protein